MKTVFFASAAVAALIAAPAFAQDTAGSVGLSYQYTDADIGIASGVETNTVVLDGVVATPVFGDWTVTFAGNGTYHDSDIAAFDEETTLAGSFALTKVIGSYRVGGFVAGEEFAGSTLNTFGGVAQKYFDRATLTGVASYGTVYDADIWSVEADAAYYATPALRLNAGLSYKNAELLGQDADVLAAKIGAEYQFAASPYSAFASYTYTDSDDFALEANGIKVGVRYNFGGNLQARDRAGAGLGL